MKEDLTISQKRRIKPGGFTGESSALNRWGISALEAGLCAVIFIGCILLHFVPVYTRLGLPIEVGLSLISFATPISGLLYLSAAQVIPDAPGCPLSSAEMAFAGFFLWQFAKGKIMDIFRTGQPLWIAVAPFFVWGAGLDLLRGDYRFGALLLFAILTGCAAAALVSQSGNRLMTCLMMFLAGQALAMCLFWILKLHLGTPVQAFDTQLFGDSTLEGMRIGTARGNAGTLGPPTALVCIGGIGWFMNPPKRKWLARLVALACLAVAAPPLIGSGARGALVAVAGGVVFLLVGGVRAGRSFAGASLALAGILVVLVLGWHRLGLDERWQETTTRQEKQQTERGVVYAGRQLEWKAAWNAILDSPFVGGGKVELLSYTDTPEMWVSHSSYLDAGLAGGFPGMALFGWFVLKPIWKLWPRRREAVIGWLLAVYAVSIISIGSSSAMQYKYFWMLWGMAAVCFLPAVTKVKNRRKRQKIEGGEQPGEIGEAISRAKENEEESVRGQESVVGGR